MTHYEWFVNEKGNWARRNIKFLRPARWLALFGFLWVIFGLIQMWNLNIAKNKAETEVALHAIIYADTHNKK